MESLGALRIIAFSGGEWVIWLLILASVLVVAVITERAIIQSRETKVLQSLHQTVADPLQSGKFDAAVKAAEASPGAATNIILAGLKQVSKGRRAVEEHVSARRVLERQQLERHLLILGTLGNNAPFIGLFGTVLGVIKAFADLANAAGAGPEVVMAGLSEALVATAVGLLVAIPAVIAYNYLQKRVDDLMDQTQALVHLLLAQLKN